jgi:hypothetical protein
MADQRQDPVAQQHLAEIQNAANSTKEIIVARTAAQLDYL